MNTAIEAQLNEAKRDALVDFYLGHVIPKKKDALAKKVHTAEDLYAYLLIDPLISSAVHTSKVAEGIASLQLYLNRLVQRREPHAKVMPDEVRRWQDNDSRYAVWAGNRALEAYPENYLNPTLRKSKTTLFKKLENRLNQGRINKDEAQSAVLDYLNGFEEVSNLEVVSGYEALTEKMVYLIGRTKNKPHKYYWRTLDLTKHTDSTTSKAFFPTAWTEWKSVDAAVGNVMQGAVCPVFMNGRLYIAWCESAEQEGQGAAADHGVTFTTEDKKTQLVLSKPIQQTGMFMKLAFKRFDDTWSVPLELRNFPACKKIVYFSAYVNVDQQKEELYFLVKVDGDSQECNIYKYDALLNDVSIKTDTFNSQHLKNGSIVMHEHGTGDKWQVKLGQEKNNRNLQNYLALTAIKKDDNFIVKVKATRPKYKDELYGKPVDVVLSSISITNKSGVKVSSNATNKNEIETSLTRSYNKEPIGIIECCFRKNNQYDLIFQAPIFSIPPKNEAEYLTISSTAEPQAPQSQSEFTQYLQFPKKMGYSPIRLNTLFAKTLIQKANVSIDAVLNLDTQKNITEPDIGEGTVDVQMGFHGANGLHFWELFFHMPLLVAHRLNLEHRFDDATQWLHYLFLPSDIHGNYWRMQELLEWRNSADAEMIGPGAIDPDELAMAYPIHYRKAVFFAYIKNLVDQGDACYRELTREALGEAKQWYLQARELLGQAPTTKVARKWIPEKLEKLVTGNALRKAFKPSNTSEPDNAFSLPLNKALLDHWQQIDNRLYNLRHNLTIDGKPLSLPLFDAPLNPTELLAARGRGGAGGTRLLAAVSIPPLRFAAMMSKAMSAVEMLIQFGNALQSTLERKDAAELERLQHVQQGELLDFTLELQDLTIEMGKRTLEGLTLSKKSATTREAYYKTLFKEHTSPAEDQVRILRGAASIMTAGAPALRAAGAIASMVPNIYGTATGGMDFSGPFHAGADGLLCESEVTSILANQMEISEQYRRRAEEWELQQKLATVEVKQIDEQIAAQNQQIALFEKQKAQIKAQQAHLQANQAFLTSRFTAESLYQWMAGQLSALYFQAYDAVTSLCLFSEAAWRYETGEYETPSFIQPGAWQDLYRGLLAGETLKLALHRMDHAYLTRNERKLEIVHTVSLKQLFELKANDWASKVENLKTKGKLEFNLTEQDFDRRYPGHYLRQIVTVSVSLPAVIGPYQDVRAILTQTGSHVIVKPDIAAVKHLHNPKDPDGSQTAIKSNLRASQQIALSTGVDDSGLFTLNFGDERYLPFEGTGAVSNWTLTFPEHTEESQKALLTSLTDVIVCIRYTAKDGGETFRETVAGLNNPAGTKAVNRK